MQTLLIARRNGRKTREIGQILGPGWDVRDLSSLPRAPRIEETGATFEENATLKALPISRIFTGLVLADDSGLEVDALNGAPGVHSARFAGPNANDHDNNQLLLDRLENVENRSARFVCVIALVLDGELIRTFRGTVEGRMIDPLRDLE